MSEPVLTPHAPQPIGPYSQAVKANGFVFVSGQVAIVPGSEEVLRGDVQQQTKQVLENLKAILEAAGTSLDKAVKCTVYLADMNDFPAMNAIYGSYFGKSAPARATVQVSRLPKDVAVEIDVIAVA